MRNLTIGPDIDFPALVGKTLYTSFGMVTVITSVRAERYYQGASFEVREERGGITYYGLYDGDTLYVVD